MAVRIASVGIEAVMLLDRSSAMTGCPTRVGRKRGNVTHGSSPLDASLSGLRYWSSVVGMYLTLK